MNAVARIEASRARLRNAMMPPPALEARASDTGLLAWLERLKHQPSIAVIVDALQSWWLRHPMRPLVHVASEATNAVARPIAQHNPVALVAAAGLLGVVFAWSRPWRWALKPALFAGLLPQLVSRVVAHLPLESWLAAFGSVGPAARPTTEPQRTSP
ncbi:MAG: hypothetical protein ABL916_21685 [Burkholderiaceae bacterium]